MTRRVARAYAEQAAALEQVHAEMQVGRDAYAYAVRLDSPPIMARTIVDLTIAGRLRPAVTLEYLRRADDEQRH